MSKTFILPEGSFDFEEIANLSAEDAEFIATWMAEAFSKTDCFAYVAVGKTYAEAPKGHYLFFRSFIDRGAAEGYHVVNKTRTALRTVFAPGRKDERLDVTYKTPYDENFKVFLEHCGGAEAFKARMSTQLSAAGVELKKLYGEDFGLSQYRSGGFGVHPECQGKGVGRALQAYIVNETTKAGKKYIFLSEEYNAPYYQKLGCKLVGGRIPTGIDDVGRKAYPPGNDFLRLCEI